MPPFALALAILLHATIGTALWLMPVLNPKAPQDEPIMLLFDSSPSNTGPQELQRTGPPVPSTAANPQPSSAPSLPEPQQALAPAPPSTPSPAPMLPLFEFSVPPVTPPPPPPTSRDFVKPAKPPIRPALRAQPPLQRPSAQQRPPADLPSAMPSPLPGPEPGDVLIGRGRQRNDYLSQVFRHLEPHRLNAGSGSQHHGRVVTRVTLGRDGRLIDVRIDTSSGSTALDAVEVTAIRRASPFPPVPANMPGDPVILVLPINY
jgi:protein TonB